MMRAMICLAILVVAASAFAQAPNEDLWRLYMAREHATVLDSTYARLERAPGNRDLTHLLGRTLFDMGRKEEAMVHLRPQAEGAIHDHRYAWALLYVAGHEFELGHDEAATTMWREARDAAITHNSARNAETSLRFFALHKDFDDWQRRRSEHFIFAFSPKLVGRGLDDYVREHERAYAELAEFLGGASQRPVRYVVWDSLDEAREMCGIESLGFAKPNLNLVHTRWEQTLGHELTHVMSFQVLAPIARTRLINEGLAIRLDLTGRDRMALARAAVAAAELEGLNLSAWWDDRGEIGEDVYYPVAGAWIDRLLERGGRNKLLALAADQTLDAAREIYGSDLDAWMAEFSAALFAEEPR